MNCPKCNHEIPEGMKFCPSCGYAVPQKRYCPNCGKELHDGMVFCSSCGTNVTDNQKKESRKKTGNANSDIVCPICGEPLSIDDCQCPNCHRNLYYKCNGCNENFTYGELIRSKGSCPQCGVRIGNLYNIPDDKYPFYIPPTNQTSNQQSNSNNSQQSQEDEGKGSSFFGKLFKYCYIGAMCWLALILCSNIYTCSCGHRGSSVDSEYTTPDNLKKEIRRELAERGYNGYVTNLQRVSETRYNYSANVNVNGVSMNLDGAINIDNTGISEISVGMPH